VPFHDLTISMRMLKDKLTVRQRGWLFYTEITDKSDVNTSGAFMHYAIKVNYSHILFASNIAEVIS